MVGTAAVGALLLAGMGSVLLTYFGLREYTPVGIPDQATEVSTSG